MKKKMRFLSLLLAAALILGALPGTAFAAEEDNGESTTVTNEYEMILQAREAQEAQQREGNIFKNSSFNDDGAELAYLERAALPEETLESMGYSPEQIAILKAYDGGPLEEHPELLAASSNLTITANKSTMGRTSASATFTWSWDIFPVIYLTDGVAFQWRGTATTGSPLDINIDETPSLSYVKVDYYKAGLNTYHDTETQDLHHVDAKTHGQADIPMSMIIDNAGTTVYAKSGIARIYVDIVDDTTGLLQEVTFSFAYAHTSVSLGASVSVSFDFASGPSSVGISIAPTFATKASIVGYQGIAINYNGNVTKFT